MPRPKTTTKSTAAIPSVTVFLDLLEHPLRKEIDALRKIIMSAGKTLTEHIKWNAPSFCLNGDDRITFNLQGKGFIRLVFHRGAKAKPLPTKGRLFDDTTGLLEWAADDRAVLKIKDMDDIKEKKEALVKLIQQWLELTAHQIDNS